MKIQAIIPAKKTSNRLPGKNVRDFHGKPLVVHKATQLLAVPEIDQIIVATDDHDKIPALLPNAVDWVKRDPAKTDEKKFTLQERIKSILDVPGVFDGDIILWAHCTNPLISPATYSAAINAFLDAVTGAGNGAGGYDSLVSMEKCPGHWFMEAQPGKYAPVNWKPFECVEGYRHPVADELLPLWRPDGGIFIRFTRTMKAKPYLFGKAPKVFQTPPHEVADIDTLEDFNFASMKYNYFHNNEMETTEHDGRNPKEEDQRP